MYIQGDSKVCRATVRATFTCPSADQPITSNVCISVQPIFIAIQIKVYTHLYIMSLVCIIRIILYMISHVCIFRMIGRSAGRHIDRPRAKYRSTSINIYISHVCIFRMKGGSAGRHIDRPGAKYRYTLKSIYTIYIKACMYYQDER